MPIILVMEIITLPLYTVSYGIAHLLKVKGREDMPSIYEWMTMHITETEDEIYE